MLRAKREPQLVAKHDAFAFQFEAVEAIKRLQYAAVFHEQGLGKTKIAIDLSLFWLTQGIVDSVLVVTKKGLVRNWREELLQHTFVDPKVLGGDKANNFQAFNSPVRLYLTHYEICIAESRRLALFLKTRRVGVILDEAHKIKNPESKLTHVLTELSGGFVRRVIMTGTPIANRPYDIWSQVRFLDHGSALGDDFSSFRASLNLSNDLRDNDEKREAFESALEDLHLKLRPFSVRRTKTTACIALPEKIVENMPAELEHRQAEIYARFRDELRTVVVRDGFPTLDDAEEILKRLLRLVQVASNPFLVDEAYKLIPGKVPVLENIIQRVVDEGSKAIVWTTFTANAEWLREHLDHFGTVKVHGKLSSASREEALHTFKTDRACKVLVATPGSAKEGLTLTVANYAIFYDRSFSLDDYLQAQDRIHRISQERTCHVINIVARDSIDEWVDCLIGAKHLAAQLGQGDITASEYRRVASYEFSKILHEVLGLNDTEIGK